VARSRRVRGRRGLDVEAGQQVVVPVRELVAARDEPFELGELRRAERALDVGDACVRRQLGDLVEPATMLWSRHHPVRAEPAQARRELE